MSSIKNNIILNSLSASFLTTIIIIIGALGSIYSSELIKYFPFAWSYNYSIQVIVFWGMFVITVFLFFFKQRASEKEKYESIDKLHEAIRTIPPTDFLSVFRSLYEEVSYLTATIIKNHNSKEDDIVYVIKHNLMSLITLLEKFDNKEDKLTKYGANVMIFRPTRGISHEEFDEIPKNLLFCEPELDIGALDGVLEIFQEISTSSTSKDLEEDSQIEKIALPIPKVKQSTLDNDKTPWRILPGAPYSFVTNAPNAYSDVSEIKAWCDNNGDFTENVKKQITDYFLGKNFKYMKSFVSLPFPRRNDAILGVINIHCDQKGMLESNEQLKQFSDIVKPIICNTFELVNILYSNGEKK